MEKIASFLLILPIVLVLGLKPCLFLISVLAVSGILTAVVVVDYLWTKDPTFPQRTAVKKYFQFRTAYFRGLYLTWKLEKDSSDIKSTQEQTLLRILQWNGTSEYSQKWRLDQVKSREEFRRVHPISKYQQFQSYIDRTAKGENNVIVTETPMYFCTTSGTTGAPNLIPCVSVQAQQYKDNFSLVVYHVGKIIPGVKKLKRSMKIYYNPQRCLDRTPSGILSGAATANVKIFEFGEVFTSPPPAFDIANENLCRYIHILFGLRNRDLSKIETVFVTIVYQAMEEMEREWRQLVRDIRLGTIKSDLDIPAETRRLLQEQLHPDPERADELEKEFEKGFHHVAKRIWPKLAHISCINGGPFSSYTQFLREKYTGVIPIYESIYAASEGLIGSDIWPLNKTCSYLLWPWMTFYEFVKEENMSEDQPDTLFMDQLEIGKDYEVILTNSAGLTRYRFGDVVKVIKFWNQLPIVEFQYRSGHLMNIRGEKISELTFLDCMNATVTQMANIQRVVDYAMCTSINLPEEVQILGEEPYYVLFLELATVGSVDYEGLEKQLSNAVDAKVLEVHSKYRFYREKNALGRLTVFLIKPAGFAGLRRFMLDNSKANPSQIKVPRVLMKAPLVKFIYRERMIF